MKAYWKETKEEIDVIPLFPEQDVCYLYKNTNNGMVYNSSDIELKEYYGG